jgi:hypothetical protein
MRKQTGAFTSLSPLHFADALHQRHLIPAGQLDQRKSELVEGRISAQTAQIEVLINFTHIAAFPQMHQAVDLIDQWDFARGLRFALEVMEDRQLDRRIVSASQRGGLGLSANPGSSAPAQATPRLWSRPTHG